MRPNKSFAYTFYMCSPTPDSGVINKPPPLQKTTPYSRCILNIYGYSYATCLQCIQMNPPTTSPSASQQIKPHALKPTGLCKNTKTTVQP